MRHLARRKRLERVLRRALAAQTHIARRALTEEGIGAGVQQDLRSLLLPILAREHERGLAVGQRRVHDGAYCDQRLDHLGIAHLRRYAQRGAAAFRGEFRAGSVGEQRLHR